MIDINVKIIEKFIDFNFEMDNIIIFIISFFYSILILEIYAELLHKNIKKINSFMLLHILYTTKCGSIRLLSKLSIVLCYVIYFTNLAVGII